MFFDPRSITGFVDWDSAEIGSRLGGVAGYSGSPGIETRRFTIGLTEKRESNDPVVAVEAIDVAAIDGDAVSEAASSEDSDRPSSVGSYLGGSELWSFIENEESPETLQSHLDLYHSICSTIDTQNANTTPQSHVFEASSITLYSPDWPRPSSGNSSRRRWRLV